MSRQSVGDTSYPSIHSSGLSTRKRALPVSPSSHGGSQIAACKRCRARKVKCDGAFPVCAGCSKAAVPCVVADSSTSREYTREELHQLEERLHQLESMLGEAASASQTTPRSLHNASSTFADVSPVSEATTLPARYVGREVGVDSFFMPILDALRKQSPAALNTILAPQSHAASIFNHEPHSIPSWDDAMRIVTAYFNDFHVAHPFLDAGRIADLFNRVYQRHVPPEHEDDRAYLSQRQTQQDLFQANMILAIGSVGLFRSGELALHPFGFFTAALKASPPSDFGFGAVQDIENLLLIARFGIYYNIGCSIWELGRLCVRICIELQLHRLAHTDQDVPVDEQQRRRIVFWESYCLDIFASSTLGRPFAIDDAIITTSLPHAFPPARDHGLLARFASENHWPTYHEASDCTIFNHLLALSQINAELQRFHQGIRPQTNGFHTAGQQRAGPSRAEDNFEHLSRLRNDLETWRTSAPAYHQPKCLYQTPEYFDFRFQQGMLYLTRVAIDTSPLRGSLPPLFLLRPCLRTASEVVRIFNHLRLRNLITYTRTYTHLIFTTSLIIVFLVFIQVHPQYRRSDKSPRSASQVDVEGWWSSLLGDGSIQSHRESLDTLAIAGDLLDWFASGMPDMRSYAHFFEVLRKELEREMNKALGQAVSGPRTSTEGTQPISHMPEAQSEELNPTTETIGNPASNIGIGTHGAINAPWADVPFDAQQESPEGLLFNFFPVAPLNNSTDPFQPVNGSWPFSQMPWINPIDTSLSGYDEDIHVPWEAPWEGNTDAY